MLVYDFEVYEYDWFVTIKNVLIDKYRYIHNDFDRLRETFEEYKHDLWMGYNNDHFDDILLQIIVSDKSLQNNAESFRRLKRMSNKIIEEEFGARELKKEYNLYNFPLYSIDLMSSGVRTSLKEVEGALGISIKECDVPFDLKRPLTEEEIKSVFKYNKQDVDATAKILELITPTIESKLAILQEYNMPKEELVFTNQNICAKILQAERVSREDGLQPYPKDLSIAPIRIKKYQSCVDFFTDCEEIDYKRNMKLDIAGVEHIIAAGGLHGAIPNYYKDTEMWMVDVSSYYPNMMVNFNLCTRSAKPGLFPGLVKKRMDFKAQKFKYKKIVKENPTEENKQIYSRANKLATALKLPINTISGAMKAKFSALYDERNNNWMCITGQLLLIDLIEHLEPYSTLIQSNTDGILIIPHDKEACDREIKAWEDRTRLELEKTVATRVYQKDVNNYIMLSDDGSIKCKGSYVGQYHTSETGGKFYATLRRNMNIVDDAVVDLLVKDIPLEETIICPDKPAHEYQQIKKLGSMYDDIVWINYDDNGNEIKNRDVNRINRIFASSDPHHGKLMKKHQNKQTYDSVEGISDHILVYNDDITKMKIGDLPYIDYDFYINVARKRIFDFIFTSKEQREINKSFVDLTTGKKRKRTDLEKWELTEKKLKEMKSQ